MPNKSSRSILAGYIPVIHRGYLQFFAAYPAVKEIYIFDQKLLDSIDYLRKDLRALQPEAQVKLLQHLGGFERVALLADDDLKSIDAPNMKIILPDEDISREIAKRFHQATVELYPVFLRWDRQAIAVNAPDPNERSTRSKNARQYIAMASQEAKQSSDIWRNVGAVLVDATGKEIRRAHNQGEPSSHTPWVEGDPRNVLKRGIGIETSLFTHAEALLIAEAARDGVSLKGASLYVTDFPCPVCAKLVAHSGIEACYYSEGYAVLDGRRVMEAYGVKLRRVITDKVKDSEDSRRQVPYKKKNK